MRAEAVIKKPVLIRIAEVHTTIYMCVYLSSKASHPERAKQLLKSLITLN